MNVTHSVPHQTVTFNPSSIQKIVSMEDFYTIIGLVEKFKSGEITDVQQIWMNRAQCISINEMCKKNAKKHKKFKHLTEKHIESCVAMDWLCFSPVGVPYVPINEVWFWSYDDRKVALDEYRQWCQDHESEVSLV